MVTVANMTNQSHFPIQLENVIINGLSHVPTRSRLTKKKSSVWFFLKSSTNLTGDHSVTLIIMPLQDSLQELEKGLLGVAVKTRPWIRAWAHSASHSLTGLLMFYQWYSLDLGSELPVTLSLWNSGALVVVEICQKYSCPLLLPWLWSAPVRQCQSETWEALPAPILRTCGVHGSDWYLGVGVTVALLAIGLLKK